MANYAINTTFSGTFEEAIEKTIAVLKEAGFGVLSDIDVAEKLNEKLGKEMPAYRILGACHPPSAYKAIESEPEIGLFLPCNVIVRQVGDEVKVSAIKPSVAMGMIDNSELGELAVEIEEKLQNIINLI